MTEVTESETTNNGSTKIVDVYLTKPESSTIVYIGTCIANYNSHFVREMAKPGLKEFHFVGHLSMRDYEPEMPFAGLPEDLEEEGAAEYNEQENI